MNEVFKALSHPARRRMVAMLRDGPLASGDIASRFDMAWADRHRPPGGAEGGWPGRD
jgi:DNA-binding transcriptional ArsR family regulator